MLKRRLLINAIMSVVQVMVTGVVVFLLYRFLLNTIGVNQLGIWSVVLASASFASIANCGLSGSVVKFVAKYLARGEGETVVSVIQTSVISVGILCGLVLLIAYPFAKWLLNLVVPLPSIKEAVSILPYALLSLWIAVIASVFQGALDGYQRVDTRSALLVIGASFHLILCFLLVPTYGLMGLAYAQVVQACIVLVGSWLALKRYLPLLPTIPYQWNLKLFKEMVGYGINFQLISVSQMVYDPITKALLTKFGGLSLIGFYEMASRMVLQLRALPVAANQVIIPAIANLQEKIPGKIGEVYLTSYQLLLYLSLPLFSLIIVCTPIISELWIGYFEEDFVQFAILLSIGWFLNALNAPAYFANLGIGKLRWNVAGHISIAVLNAILGFLFGIFYGGHGVVTAWVISLVFGSSIISLSYHIRHKIPLIELIPKESRIIIGVCLSTIIFSLIIRHILVRIFSPIGLNSVIVLLVSIIIFIPLWLHPMRRRLVAWVSNDLLNREAKA